MNKAQGHAPGDHSNRSPLRQACGVKRIPEAAAVEETNKWSGPWAWAWREVGACLGKRPSCSPGKRSCHI